MRRQMRAQPWIDKLCVRMDRQRHQPMRHVPLKERLALNRGRAKGLPIRYPSQWVENRERDRWQGRVLKMVATGEIPF